MSSAGLISKTPGVCGGEACIRGTRITVWGLVESRRLGSSDERLLAIHPNLTQEDLDAAWLYERENRLEIERTLWENAACTIEHDGKNVSAELLRRGRRLGFSDAEILQAFEPPLKQSVLDAAWDSPRNAVGA